MPTRIKKIKIQMIGVLCLLLGIASYALFQGGDILFGSRLTVRFIPNQTTGKTILTVSGKAPHSKEITINGRETTIEIDGSFTEPVALLAGYNIISVHTTNVFGKERSRVFATYTETPPPAITLETQLSNPITN